MSVGMVEQAAPLPFDPNEWAEDFGRWALAHCLFRDGCLWRVEALHDAFCDWCNARELVACRVEVFATLLELEGFAVTTGMVYGLVPKAEYLALTTPERGAKAAPTWRGAGR